MREKYMIDVDRAIYAALDRATHGRWIWTQSTDDDDVSSWDYGRDIWERALDVDPGVVIRFIDGIVCSLREVPYLRRPTQIWEILVE